MESVDIVLKDGLIITINENNEVIQNANIAIKDGLIHDIYQGDKYQSSKIIDLNGNIVMPGLINTHTHISMTFLRGLADDLPLMDWLLKYIWPAEAKFVNQENVVIGAELGMIEMIKSGTTTFNDMYFLEDEIAKSVKKIGMRAYLGEGPMDLIPPPPFYDENGNLPLLEKYKNDDLVTITAVAHSPYTVSAQKLKEVRELSQKYKTIYHIHVAETEVEVQNMLKEKGMTPVEYLDSLGILSNNTLSVHTVHVNDHDIDILSERGVSVAHNPESNLKLGSGIAPVDKFLKANINVALGTDGAASNNNLNMFEELSMVAKLHKGLHKDPTLISAKEALRMATINGAKALGAMDILGSIEIGKKGDLIVIDKNHSHLKPFYNPISHLVYSVNGSEVLHSIINGKLVMENREILTVSEKDIIARAENLGNKIQKINS